MPSAVSIVQTWFERLAAGDPAPELCAPDIEIRNWPESPVPGPYRGHDGVRAWWRGVNDPDIGVEIQMFGLEQVHEVDDHTVVTVQRATGRGRYSGLAVDQLWGSIIRVADGKIASAAGYSSAEAALAAAGLPQAGSREGASGNADVVRAIADAVARQDLDALMSFLHEEVEHRDTVNSTELRGHDDMRRHFLALWEQSPGAAFSVHDLVEAGDWVVARQSWRGLASGDLERWVARRFAGRRVRRIEIHATRAEALAAAGLPP